MNVPLQLATARLTLRPWQDRDRAPFAAMNADREVMAFFVAPMSRAQSDEAVDRYLAAYVKDGFSFLVAELTATQDFVGVIGMQHMRDVVPNVRQPAVEIGWRLARAHHNQGLATEGACAVIDAAFRTYNLPELLAITAIANEPSRNVAAKLGMQHRPDLDFDHPRVPANILHLRHTVYQLQNHTYAAKETIAC